MAKSHPPPYGYRKRYLSIERTPIHNKTSALTGIETIPGVDRGNGGYGGHRAPRKYSLCPITSIVPTTLIGIENDTHQSREHSYTTKPPPS